MFILTVTPEAQYRCDLGRGLMLQFDPLTTNRTSAIAQVFTSCCSAPLEAAILALPDPSPAEGYVCGVCFKRSPLPFKELLLLNRSDTWVVSDPSLVAAAGEALFEPLIAEVWSSCLQELLVNLMNATSAAYTWRPEGNLRGPDPLRLSVRLNICREMLERVCTESLRGNEVICN